MTAKEAYKKIVQFHEGERLIECCDFGEFIGFIFAPSESDEPFGGAYDCINVNSGNRHGFHPTENFELFDKGKMIPVESLI